jgi:hypothetical protein
LSTGELKLLAVVANGNPFRIASRQRSAKIGA